MKTLRGLFTLRLAAAASCIFVSAAFAAGSAGAVSPTAVPWFEEVSQAAGIDFTCRSGHVAGRHLFPEIILGGCALFDMDGDDDLDLYFAQGGVLQSPAPSSAGTPSAPADAGGRLYRNDGAFRFADVTAGSGARGTGYGIGVAAGDADGDGDADLYVMNVGRNTLLRNDGAGRFSDVTEAAGVGHPGWATSGAFLDIDADADLDLWVVNYLNWTVDGELDCFNNAGAPDYCLPTNYEAPACCTLYRNDGGGRFADVTDDAGLRAVYGNGLGVVSGDFDGAGGIDVFVANDTMMNQLWINRGGGRFVDEALLRGCALDENGKAKAGMGTVAADPDDDGDLDLLVVNLERESDSFYANEGEFYLDRTAAAGLAVVSRPFTRFGVGWVDFDNDGVLDLYQANGRVQLAPEPILPADPYAEPNLVMRGVGDGRFEEVLPRGGTASPLVATSRGAAFGDLDGDGGIDIVVVNRDSRAHVLRNIVPNRGGWISFRVLERNGADALGAVVTAAVGGKRLRRDALSAFSYASASDPRAHFGLGAASGVTEVRVRWVDGTEESFGDFEGGRVVELRRGAGR